MVEGKKDFRYKKDRQRERELKVVWWKDWEGGGSIKV